MHADSPTINKKTARYPDDKTKLSTSYVLAVFRSRLAPFAEKPLNRELLIAHPVEWAMRSRSRDIASRDSLTGSRIHGGPFKTEKILEAQRIGE
jgi:hypothetical protein